MLNKNLAQIRIENLIKHRVDGFLMQAFGQIEASKWTIPQVSTSVAATNQLQNSESFQIH